MFAATAAPRCRHHVSKSISFGRWIHQVRLQCAASKNNSSSCSSSTTTKTTWKGVTKAFQDEIDDGKLLYDPLQHHAARKLARTQTTLESYDHESFRRQLKCIEDYQLERQKQIQQQQQEQDQEQMHAKGEVKQSNQSKKDLCNNEEEPPPPSISIQVPRGFYIHGPVGTGKSMMLNLFFEHSPKNKKRRLHFHSFLQDIHKRIHLLNKELLDEHGRSFHVDTTKSRNPILRIAQQVSEEVTLLCIDEFQVTDIADAMILAQFFGELWRQGVIVAATSNRPPDALYEGGLNREYFLPFIDLLKRYCVVHHLGVDKNIGDELSETNAIDYRRITSGVSANGNKCYGDYFHLATTDTKNGKHNASQQLDRLFLHIQEKYRDSGTPTDAPLLLQVNFKRTIPVHRSHSNIIARFTFDELCTTELGSAEYNSIANHFQIVMIENIPHLNLKYPDRARRFITLIDELYEAECCFVCSAVDAPDRLFITNSTEEESNKDSTMSANNEVNIDGSTLAVDVAQSQGIALSSLASVKELSFAFRRAASRIVEMSSKSWWEKKLPKDISLS
jgi:protein AFG1